MDVLNGVFYGKGKIKIERKFRAERSLKCQVKGLVRHGFLNNQNQLSGFELKADMTTHSFGGLSPI